VAAKTDSLVSRAAKPTTYSQQHLGSQFRYLNSVVWEAKPTIFNILAGKIDSLVLVSWAAKPAIVSSILAANSDILIQLSGKLSQLYVKSTSWQ
jgi:hypothetical protein